MSCKYDDIERKTNKWSISRLGDDVEIKGRVGWKGYKTSDLRDSGPIVIGGANIKNNLYLDLSEIKHLSRTKYEESPEIMLKKDDLIIVTRGNGIGDVSYYDGSLEEATINPSVVILSEYKGNPKFLFYYLISTMGKNNVLSYKSGSSIPAIYQKQLATIQYPKPSLEEQNKIVELLQPLDDKIELNNEMNKTLEEIAQSIFKRWFVDFEFPNEDGKPYKSSGGEMVESGLGMIPKEWEIGTLDNIGIFKNGKKIKQELRDDNGKYIIYGSNGVIGKTNEVLQDHNCIILGRVGAYCGSVQLSLEPCWITDNAIMATSKEEKYLPYLHRFLLNYPLRESAGGSAQPLINQGILKSITTSIATQDLFEKYYDISKEILLKIDQNIKENNKLSEIRDTLLPKLMSGEIILDKKL